MSAGFGRILAVGTRMPTWIQAGFEEYQRRMPRDFTVQLREMPLSRRGGGRGVEEEGAALLDAIEPGELVVCLEVEGKEWSTRELAERMRSWRDEGRKPVFLIGGPDGLSQACRDRADHAWSLSRLTLPHPLVRVLLMEQLYRAWSINSSHPYHR